MVIGILLSLPSPLKILKATGEFTKLAKMWAGALAGGADSGSMQAGFNEEDFSRWVEDRKLYPLNSVRKLPQILNNSAAKNAFLNQGARAAITTIDAPDLDTRLKEANISQLAKALQEKIGQLSYDDAEEIKAKTGSEEHLDLLDIFNIFRHFSLFSRYFQYFFE